MTMQDLQLTIIFSSLIMIATVATYIKAPSFEFLFDFRDAIVFLGIALIGIGAYMIYEPSAFIVCGAMLFWLGRPR